MIKKIVQWIRRKPAATVEPVTFNQIAGRRAQARAFLRSRRIYHVRGLYGAPGKLIDAGVTLPSYQNEDGVSALLRRQI